MIRLKRASYRPDTADEVQYNNRDPLPPEKEYREKYIELVEALFPVVNKSDTFTRIVMISNSLFEAERGALFWFKNGKFTQTPELRASVNLKKEDISKDNFKSNLKLMLTAFKKQQLVFDTCKLSPERINGKDSEYSAVSIPLKIKGEIKAVLYHDRFHSQDGFSFFSRDNNLADQLIRHLSSYVEYGLNSEQAIGKSTSARKNKTKDECPDICSGNQSILHQSKIMENLIQEADKAAQSDTSVLIVGETGVGKELLARRIHSNSDRKKNPFVTINATTIPEGLFESELFGHEKGSFTSAESRKKGLIEVADGGTLFIDEVGEMPLHMQVKLLRAIQEKTFYRVGGTQMIHSDFRLVTATNSDLLLEACEGRFREDLYYRLNLFSFTIPPLRDRREDILLIAERYLDFYTRKYCKEGLFISARSKKMLQDYTWPGNVRELKNVIEKSVIIATSGQFLEINIPENKANMDFRNPFADSPTLDEINRRYIDYILNKTNGKISGPGGAAEMLNIGRTTLTARMKRLGMR